MAPADEEISTPTLVFALRELLRDRLGPDAELSVAGAALVSRRTDYIAGHLAPLLLPPEVIVVSTRGVVDLATSVIYTATGDGGTALGIAATDLLNLSRAIVLPSDGSAENSAPADGGYDVDTVDRIELDAIPLPARPITLPVGSEGVLGQSELSITAIPAPRARRRTTSGAGSPPSAPAVAATAS
jgi:hypothetical protein